MCLDCWAQLPKTHFHRLSNNPVQDIFIGRCQFAAATAFFHFQKGGSIQQLMHRFKYQNQPEIGRFLGRMAGKDLKDHFLGREPEVIVPVPLHPDKLAKRGYNQAEVIARGLAEVLPLEVSTGNLIRGSFSETQTRKGRFDRWRNVEKIFTVRRPQEFRFRHILLVDDVVTTGATIEACYTQLAGIDEVQLSLFTLAVAE